jgi:hypothetical protein
MRTAAPAISIHVSASPPKILFYISRVGDVPALLETAEPDVPLGPNPRVL